MPVKGCWFKRLVNSLGPFPPRLFFICEWFKGLWWQNCLLKKGCEEIKSNCFEFCFLSSLPLKNSNSYNSEEFLICVAASACSLSSFLPVVIFFFSFPSNVTPFSLAFPCPSAVCAEELHHSCPSTVVVGSLDLKSSGRCFSSLLSLLMKMLLLLVVRPYLIFFINVEDSLEKNQNNNLGSWKQLKSEMSIYIYLLQKKCSGSRELVHLVMPPASSCI